MSDRISSYRRGSKHSYLLIKWKETRKLSIEQIRNIAKEIQKSETNYRKGQVVYSGAGIISGGLAIAGILSAPFTAGLSLGLTTTSLAVGGTSGVVGFTHYLINNNQVNSRYKIAKQVLERDNELTEELMKYIKVDINKMGDCGSYFETGTSLPFMLKRFYSSVNDIYSASIHDRAFMAVQAYQLDAAAELLDISKTTQKVMPGITQDMVLIIDDAGVVKFAEATSKVAKEAAAQGKASTKFVQIASKVALPIAVFGMVIDMVTLVDNADKLSSGELSDYAWQLMKVADKLEDHLRICEEEMRNHPELDCSENVIF